MNALRDDVRRWRDGGWRGASETTKKLLRHWWREDRSRRLFFCQLEAVETVIYLREMLAQERHAALQAATVAGRPRGADAGAQPAPGRSG